MKEPFEKTTGNQLTFGEDGCLPCELFQHLRSTGQSVSALADADVQAELANAELSHGVLLFLTLVLKCRKKTSLIRENTWGNSYTQDGVTEGDTFLTSAAMLKIGTLAY